MMKDLVHISQPDHHAVPFWFELLNLGYWLCGVSSCALVDSSRFSPNSQKRVRRWIGTADFIPSLSMCVFPPHTLFSQDRLWIITPTITEALQSLAPAWSVMFLSFGFVYTVDRVRLRPAQLFIACLTLSLFHISDYWSVILICLPWFFLINLHWYSTCF